MGKKNYNIISERLTIIIPTYNEEKYIGRTLDELSKQNGIDGVRVIVSDGNSTDQTRAIVLNRKKKYRGKLKIEIIDGGRVAEGRNNGAKVSTTDYLLFMDGDVVLNHPNTIQYSLNKMVNDNYQLVTSEIECYSGSWKASLSFWIFNFVNKLISLRTPFAVGTFFMIGRWQFNHLGGFDELLEHSEDYMLSRKISPLMFHISPYKIGQDDRRFKKMGYLGMTKLLFKSFQNRHNYKFFCQDVGYWK